MFGSFRAFSILPCARKHGGSMKERNGCNRVPYGWIFAFLAPTLVLFSLYTLYPSVASVMYSLFDWNGFSLKGKFIQFGNYVELFHDDLFWNSLKNTLLFLLYAVPGRFLFSLFLALLLTSAICPCKSAFRTLVFIPVVTTGAIIGTIMTLVFDPGNGPVNLILMRLRLIDKKVFFLGNSDTALATASIIWIWKWTGTSLVYWIASLQSIPNELYEAATIDGANTFQRFKAITFPLLVPFGLVIFVLTVSDAMKVFDLMLTLTGGGPFYRTEVMELFIYRHAFTASVPRIGYASAAASLFGGMFIVITLLQSMIRKKGKEQR